MTHSILRPSTAAAGVQSFSDDPIAALLARPEGAVLAILVQTVGPSYRDAGTLMVLWPDGQRFGNMSSGCIEDDLSQQALAAREEGAVRRVRYGEGSPYFDLKLPCGGGLEIVLLPAPDLGVLAEIARLQAQRTPCGLTVNCETGAMQVASSPRECVALVGAEFHLPFLPRLAFLVFGHGAEATAFSHLAASLQYDVTHYSHEHAEAADHDPFGVALRGLRKDAFPAHPIDPWTAVVLFFHDHEWEPPILREVLASEAFYIGAQGSKRTNESRMAALEVMGVSEAARARLHSPVGLIGSARDEKTLAISVLAEVVSAAKAPRSKDA